RCWSKAEVAGGSRKGEPFGQRREHHGDLLGGRFQTVQGRVTTRTEGGAAGLTPKGLDAFGLAMRAISNQRMNVCICNAKVGTLSVRTGIALGLHTLGRSPAAFHLAPGTRRSRRCSCARRGRRG